MSNLLEIHQLYKSFSHDGEMILRGIDLSIKESESVAIVGESGCGKTTLGKIIVDIHQPTKGTVTYRGKNIRDMNKKEYREFRLKVQMVQQDSFAALNPYKTIYQSLKAAILVHRIVKNEKEARQTVKALLEDVGLTPTSHFIDKFPHQLSGGQRQRILIARAISVKPEVIVADEPVSMVDVSLRISLLKLLRKMNEKYGISFVYITHDLATARYISDHGKLVVMYLGEIVESADIATATSNPLHPYFRALIAAVPKGINVDHQQMPSLPLKGVDIPNIKQLPQGCIFHPRCIYAKETCSQNKPLLRNCHNAQVACFFAEEIDKQQQAKNGVPQ
ncbi:ABC transporter ATP-binding protein [Enterococcus sp. RIT-PI-f]|uniref:ABC transporter ATP-binding protein n=1 Tax=Enterococcus sp. RIT-PI-f TaxID=1690244 RepID=UPI0006B9CC37|nr:ABC transporter ATP-binding protein [Enterococcus sp. RIT-PI-f]KPG70630.1 peptide ABC transporter ATP-binding protein [Enterococcus sp. RIT-PI-f]